MIPRNLNKAGHGNPFMTSPSWHYDTTVLCYSDTAYRLGLDNHPTDSAVTNLIQLEKLLSALSHLLQHRLTIHSAYRNPTLNTAVGGVPTSKHCQGLAADISCAAFGSPMLLATVIAASTLPFEQCLLEFGGWVHLTCPDPLLLRPPKREVISIRDKTEGYIDGLHLKNRS
jgi:zinc D-Ala-D-Ala carboxypeptidase